MTGSLQLAPPHTLLVLTGRGRLPFESLHSEPLYLHALRSLAEAFATEVMISLAPGDRDRVEAEIESAGLRARLLSDNAWWVQVCADHGSDPARDLLVHDPLCPLTSPQFLRSLPEQGAGKPMEGSLIAFRPVTDTVKSVVEERIVGTIDREGLAALTSPVLIRAEVLRRGAVEGSMPPLADFSELVSWLRSHGTLELVKAPSLARRVDDVSAVNLLECVDEIGRRTLNGVRATRTP